MKKPSLVLPTGSKGTTLVSLVIAMALSSVALMITFQAMQELYASTKRVSKHIEMTELQRRVRAAFSDLATCSCQLDASVNTAQANDLFIDPSQPSPSDINLRSIRSSCDFASTDNLIAQEDSAVPGMSVPIHVERIQLVSLKSLGKSRYLGSLEVSFASGPDGITSAPIRQDIGVIIDSSLGTPGGRPIKSCFGTSEDEPLSDCPTGMELVGTAGAPGSFCIEKNRRPEEAYSSAYDTCKAVLHGDRKGSLCSLNDLLIACTNGVIGPPGTWETAFSRRPDRIWVGIGNSCTSGGLTRDLSHPYRCCIY